MAKTINCFLKWNSISKIILLVRIFYESRQNQDLFIYFIISLTLFKKSFLLLFYYSCPNFPPLPFSNHPTICSHSQFPHCCPCPLVIHTCCLSSPFSFPPLIPSPLLSAYFPSAPCFYTCDSVLFISLFCSLDSTYEWDHMVFVFHWLAYFT